MSNGEIVHLHCFEKLTSAIDGANKNLESVRIQVSNLQRQLQFQHTYLGKVARFFGQGADAENLKLGLEFSEANLRSAESALKSARAKALPIFDVMLDYPPDWSLRSAAVLARDRVCTKCGSSKTLQAHHVVPLSKGGTNQLINLKLLCKRCHQREHGSKKFSGVYSGKPLAFADRVQILNSAISCGCDVEFMYRKPTDRSHKKRRVTPRELVEMQHERDIGQTLCLKGYCHLRHQERHFALKRMMGLKLVKG